jgi:hypothetical protein
MKAHRINVESAKTYATRENAIKAVEKKCGPNHEHFGTADVRYVIVQNEAGRYVPLFIGESALNAGMHFSFNVAN